MIESIEIQQDALEPNSAKLKQFLAQRAIPHQGESCRFCNADIDAPHVYVINIVTHTLISVCPPCYLLFTLEGAAQGKYKAVPQRRIYLPDLALTQTQWEALQIPVGIAFFHRNTSQSCITSCYPGPEGATQSLVRLETWDALEEANPILEKLVPDVESLVIHHPQDHQRSEGGIVPIDVSDELMKYLKQQWRGLDGGEEAWKTIHTFVTDMRTRSETFDIPLQCATRVA